jgi:FMN-dependent oxidoreductase (nitrilotriacetate monooxygenase family)
MGQDEVVGHDSRYDAADEFMDVVYRLWEGSWADGALKRDKEAPLYAEPSLIQEIVYRGAFHKLRAAGPTEPSPQRVPMLFQAGGSERGRRFAATHAEGVFINGPKVELVASQVAEMRRLAAEYGRDPRSLKFFAGATVIVDDTEALAHARYEDYRRYASVEGMLAQLSAALGIDLSRYPLDEPIRYEETDAARSQLEMLTRRGAWTVRQAIDSMALSGRNLLIVGTPQQAADELVRWVDEADVDGFNIARVVAQETMEAFVELVVPELQRRGLFKTQYRPGTLREKVLGGDARTAPDHPASRQRR